MIRLQKIKKKYDKEVLFSDFNANLNSGDIIGIFGENGSGKTTMLDIIARKILPTEGKVNYEPQNLTVGYFEQVSDSEIEEYEAINKSSGEIVKQNLKRIMDEHYDIYIFDEPTNHLDANSVTTLAIQIKKLNGIKVIASHDRNFLSSCATKIWDIDDNKITVYNSNFEKFIDKKSENRFEIEDTYSKILRKVTNLRLSDNKRQDKFSMMRKSKKADPVKFFRKKTKFLHQNKVYKNRIQRLLKEELPKLPKDKQQLIIDFINSPFEEIYLARINNVSKKIGKRQIFKDIDFEILPSEKILISGANGAGKTTLLKIIAKIDTDYSGDIEYSSIINFRYFKQENFQDLTYNYKVKEEVTKFIFEEQLKSNNEIITPERLENLYKLSNVHNDQIIEHLEKLGFENKHLEMFVNDLSEGEKIKLRFAKLLLLEPNLLILDEPTNHLDLDNKLGIINAIKRFKGACIVVTHDKDLINEISWDFHLEM